MNSRVCPSENGNKQSAGGLLDVNPQPNGQCRVWEQQTSWTNAS